MDFKKRALPSAVMVDGIFYDINTDFQYFLTFLNSVRNGKITREELMPVFMGKVPANLQGAASALLKFAFPKKELPRNIGEKSEDILLDYEIDGDLIYAAFYQQYGIDLFDESLHLHWYKFQALLQGLQNTKLNQIMEFRSWKPGKNDSGEYKAHMQKLKETWRIEERLSDDEKEMIEKFDSLLKC